MVEIVPSNVKYILPETIAIEWHYEDVISVRPRLNPTQAKQVLRHVEQNHDATCGISWETLKVISDILFEDLKENTNNNY